jgi:hypothetical protein
MDDARSAAMTAKAKDWAETLTAQREAIDELIFQAERAIVRARGMAGRARLIRARSSATRARLAAFDRHRPSRGDGQ